MAHKTKSQLGSMIGLVARSSCSLLICTPYISLKTKESLASTFNILFDASNLQRGHHSNMTWKSKKQEPFEDHPTCLARCACGQ